MAKQPRHQKPDATPGEIEATSHGTRAVIATLLANLVIAVAKFAGFVITGSSSLLAEGVHSAADSGNQGLLLFGGKRAKRAAIDEHPFGYGRAQYFWSFVVALVLFSLGGLFALSEGTRKLANPEPIENPQWAFAILGFAILAQGMSFRTALKKSRTIKGEATYWQFIRRAKAPELPVVILEGSGAVVGLVLALGGISASVLTNDGRWDGYGSIAIGVLLVLMAIVLVVEMKSLLIGEGATRKDIEAIRGAIEIDPDVMAIIHLRTEHLGPDELLVGIKVEFQHELTLAEVAGAIDRVERSIRIGVPAARIIFIEPDVHDAQGTVGFVEEHAGHIDADDPAYEGITGHRPEGAANNDIWS